MTHRAAATLALAATLLGCGSTHAASSDAGASGIDAAGGSNEGGGPGSEAGTVDAGSLVTVALAACNPKVYAAGVSVGGSPPLQLLLDTGSTTLAVAGAGCASCADAGASPLYVPGPTAIDEHMDASALYGAVETTGWAGAIYEDTVATGTPSASTRVKLASIQQESLFLVGTCGAGGAPPDGVLGFAPAKTAIPGTDGFFDELVAGGTVPDVFAVQLCSEGGTLWLGGYDPAFATAPPVYTPTFPAGFDAYVYTVDLESIAVAGTTVPVPTGQYTASMLDTGSSISTLPPAAFSALTSAITASPAFSQVFGAAASSFFASPGSCVHLAQTKAALDEALPGVTLTFGSASPVTAQATATESYLLTTGVGQWCPAIAALAPTPAFQSIAAHVGAPLLRSNVVVFDRANHRVGFAPHAPCP